jgi:hypothetical protein
MESDASRLASIKGAGGVLVRHETGEFWALFDNDFQADLADGMVESRGPAFTARLVDVSELRKSTPLTIDKRTFKITRAEPDESTGFCVLYVGR